MSYLLLKGEKSDWTPGDVLGALVNDTFLSPDDVGEIRIEEEGEVSFGEVQLEGIREEPEVDRVGRSRVETAFWGDQDYVSLSKYIGKYDQMVEMERQEEMRKHEEEIRKLSGREREAKGRAIRDLSGKEEGEGLGGKTIVKFKRPGSDRALPESEISVGDLVVVSEGDPLRDENPTGTVSRKTNYSLNVAFDGEPRNFVFGKGLRLDLSVNDLPYRRMSKALRQLPFAEESELVRKLIGLSPLREVEEGEPLFSEGGLDDSQREAVGRSVAAQNVFCIHGPPGTGKTTTLVEVIRRAVEDPKKIIATADSNVAVDNLVEFLVEEGLDPVRVGHPVRITPQIRSVSLDYKVKELDCYKKSREMREKALDLKEKQEEEQIPSGRYRRGMSDDQIHQLARKGSGSRGVSPEKIKSMSRWLELNQEIDRLFEKSRKLEEKAVNKVLDDSAVICSTNSTAGSDLLADRRFDLSVIDEATQATAPSCLIPIVKSRKVVMAGDHKQLPPTVLNQSVKEGLQVTLFEDLMDRGEGKISGMLETQYRMNRRIMDFSNRRFYGGDLEAVPSVRDHNLSGFTDGLARTDRNWVDEAVDEENVITFLDTGEISAPERQRPGSTSRENPRETEILSSVLDLLLSELREEQVGVISPYHDQVSLINSRYDKDDLEVKTVDGFQGREKEAILISFVRSNEKGELGFLNDLRRLNVSLTRARRKLVMIGDSGTLAGHSTYKELIEYVKEVGSCLRLRSSAFEVPK